MSTDASKPEVVDYKGLIAELARRSKLPEAKARLLMRNLADEISVQIKTGKTVRIPGFGAFRLKDVAEKGTSADDNKSEKRIAFSAAKKFKAAADIAKV